MDLCRRPSDLWPCLAGILIMGCGWRLLFVPDCLMFISSGCPLSL